MDLIMDRRIIDLVSSFADTELLKADKKIGLFGAGRYGSVVNNYLRERGISACCFIDNDPQKQNKFIDGIQVVAFDDPIVNSLDLILSTMRNVTCDRGIVSFDSSYICSNVIELENFYFKLNDNMSKETLDAVLLSTLTGNNVYCTSIMDFNQYFCLPQFRNTCEEYFLDIGSYVGDTVEQFIWANTGQFSHIYAFEPSPGNFTALKHRVRRLKQEWAIDDEKLTLMNCAVGGHEARAGMSNLTSGSSSFIDEALQNKSEQIIEIKTVDQVLKDKKVTFIKADIEGMELDMLKGAKQVILENKPKIAICVYHNIFDLLEITSYLHELVPQYKMALRHHSPTLYETVLYCWID